MDEPLIPWCPRPLLSGLLLASLGGLTGCATGRNTVTGRITPEHFEFTTIVGDDPEEPGEPHGWRAVCIHARITMGDSGATSICKFEVGMPLQNGKQGMISREQAQEASANMANRAMYKILSEAHPGTGHYKLCRDFKTLYNLMLKEKIQGAEAGECWRKNIKTIHFAEPYYCDFDDTSNRPQ